MALQDSSRGAAIKFAAESQALRYPTTGMAGCCARAVAGHDGAAPPSKVMTSRRFN
jgi:hypothetical protein